MKKSKPVGEPARANADEAVQQGRAVGECLGCGEQKEIVSRGLCDTCRKKASRESLEQSAKRRVLNERGEREQLLKIFHHFQTGYLRLGLSPEDVAAELLGLLSRCATQFAPVLHLLNPAAAQNKSRSGSGQTQPPSTSTEGVNGVGAPAPDAPLPDTVATAQEASQ